MKTIQIILIVLVLVGCSSPESEVSNLGGRAPIICYKSLPDVYLCRDKTGVLWLCQNAYNDICDKFESIAKTFEVTTNNQSETTP